MNSTRILSTVDQVISARSVLVLALHAGEEIFACSGSLICQVNSGCVVSVVVLTDGAFGEADQDTKVKHMREAESAAAAALIGYRSPCFWRLADRQINYSEILVDKVTAAILSADADLVYAPGLSEVRPDHRALAMVAVESVRRLGAGVRLAMYQVGVPLSPTVLIDISEVAEKKSRAIKCFATQQKIQGYADHTLALDRFRTVSIPAKVEMVEAFSVYNGAEMSQSSLLEKWALGLEVDESSEISMLYSQLKAEHERTLAAFTKTQTELASIAAHAKVVEERYTQTQLNLTHMCSTAATQEQQHTQKVARLEQTISHLQHELVATGHALQAHKNSTSWRLTSPLRFVGRQLLRAKLVAKALPYAVSMSGGVQTLPGFVFRAYKREGFKGIKRRVLFSAARGETSASDGQALPREYDYREWLFRYDSLTDDTREVAKRRINSWARLPLVSVVMPVYNPPLAMLTAAIASVQAQLYSNWELCIADDASHSEGVRALLREYADQDARIRLAFRTENGHISAASNTALGLATGEYIALLDNDDLLHEMALFWVADAINANPSAGLIYSDEDKVDAAGNRFDPYFKPDWNPDLFLSHNMVCHLGVYRAELIEGLGGFREGLEGAQDYDLALRCVEQLAQKDIVHIPRVLYHWRSHPGSTARAGSEKSYAIEAGQRALNEHFSRTGLDARVEVLDSGMYRARYALPGIKPLVSLIVLTRNGLAHVKQCIDSIFAKTTYKNYEILLLDNNSDDPGALAYFRLLADDSRVRVLRDERAFNHSALNNSAVHHARGEYIALIHSDIEVISPDWLDEMLGLASQPAVGAVGVRLWYPDNTLQHGGVITGLRGVAGHAHKHFCKGDPGYFHHAQIIKTVSVVTAACLLIKKSVFLEVGGLNEVELKVAFNDVDFCLRVREAGYRNIWTPYAEFYHHESPTDGHDDIPEKQTGLADAVSYLKARWGASLTNDPAYSPNLTLDREDFSYAWPPRTHPIY